MLDQILNDRSLFFIIVFAWVIWVKFIEYNRRNFNYATVLGIIYAVIGMAYIFNIWQNGFSWIRLWRAGLIVSGVLYLLNLRKEWNKGSIPKRVVANSVLDNPHILIFDNYEVYNSIEAILEGLEEWQLNKCIAINANGEVFTFFLSENRFQYRCDVINHILYPCVARDALVSYGLDRSLVDNMSIEDLTRELHNRMRYGSESK